MILAEIVARSLIPLSKVHRGWIFSFGRTWQTSRECQPGNSGINLERIGLPSPAATSQGGIARTNGPICREIAPRTNSAELAIACKGWSEYRVLGWRIKKTPGIHQGGRRNFQCVIQGSRPLFPRGKTARTERGLHVDEAREVGISPPAVDGRLASKQRVPRTRQTSRAWKYGPPPSLMRPPPCLLSKPAVVPASGVADQLKVHTRSGEARSSDFNG